jgi:hypothetical protein
LASERSRKSEFCASMIRDVPVTRQLPAAPKAKSPADRIGTAGLSILTFTLKRLHSRIESLRTSKADRPKRKPRREGAPRRGSRGIATGHQKGMARIFAHIRQHIARWLCFGRFLDFAPSGCNLTERRFRSSGTGRTGPATTTSASRRSSTFLLSRASGVPLGRTSARS